MNDRIGFALNAPQELPLAAHAETASDARPVLLVALGERVKLLRARRGMTRKELAKAAEVSERHLANLEYGQGNASILVLQQVAQGLGCSLAELLGDVTASSPEWLMIRQLLEARSEADLRRARLALSTMFESPTDPLARHSRIALIGLRGAGKSTLGKLLADELRVPFVELSREIERIAGCGIREVHDLYGTAAYRRYERRALDDVIATHQAAIIATPGGIVSDPATFNQLLAQCTVVWLQADPKDHMSRVVAQGDMRPMAASPEAMDDLRRILAGRAAFYSKAELTLQTSRQDLHGTIEALTQLVKKHTRLGG